MAIGFRRIVDAFGRMCDEGQTRPEFENSYGEFSQLVQESLNDPPHHIRILLEQIRKFEKEHSANEITILDHGCGSGLTLHYLAEAGYRNVYGVDIAGERNINNVIFQDLVGLKGQRLIRYDGLKLPFDSGTVDFVFSQQVLEHVSDDQLVTYFAEEARVLRPGGVVLHEIPHRLIPYESHSRTWLLHYFPVPVRDFFYGALDIPVPKLLFLRWPWCYRQRLRSDFGYCLDTTGDRLRKLPERESYDGLYRLRRLIGLFLSLPAIGSLLAPIISNLVMLQLRSVRPHRVR